MSSILKVYRGVPVKKKNTLFETRARNCFSTKPESLTTQCTAAGDRAPHLTRLRKCIRRLLACNLAQQSSSDLYCIRTEKTDRANLGQIPQLLVSWGRPTHTLQVPQRNHFNRWTVWAAQLKAMQTVEVEDKEECKGSCAGYTCSWSGVCSM